MNELDLAFALCFVLPVTLVGMVLFYRLARLKIASRNQFPQDQDENVVPMASQARLASRAADLLNRVGNLEDILADEVEQEQRKKAGSE